MDEHTYKLINMLERAPREHLKFYADDSIKEIVKPAYLLASDVARVIKLLEADSAVSADTAGTVEK